MNTYLNAITIFLNIVLIDQYSPVSMLLWILLIECQQSILTIIPSMSNLCSPTLAISEFTNLCSPILAISYLVIQHQFHLLSPLFWGRLVFLAIPIMFDCSCMVSIDAIAMFLGWPESNNVNNQSSRSCSVWDRMAIQCMYPSFFFFFFFFPFLSFFHFFVLVVMARLARKGWCMGKEGQIINN